MDRFTEMALFVEVADRGSLGAAAEALGLSNPAATRYLASLEERLQVRLVERNTRRLYLTSEGQDFLERARHVLRKVCTTLVATSADARVFRWRQLRRDSGHSRADSRPVVDPFGRCGRTHPRAPCKSGRRTIHRLESANSVCSCAVFLAKPR